MNIIFEALNQLLHFVYLFSGDWGIAIIFVTVLVRIALIPLSFNQRRNADRQAELTNKIQVINDKNKNNPQDVNPEEMHQLSKDSAKSILGSLTTLLQLPVMYSLYHVFSSIPGELPSMLLPWIHNLKVPDTYFIIPVIAMLIQLFPGILTSFNQINSAKKVGMTFSQIILIGAISMIFLVKAPVTMGIYWITSSLFTLLEQFIYGKYIKKLV